MKTEAEIKQELSHWENFLISERLTSDEKFTAVQAIEQLEWVLQDGYPSQAARYRDAHKAWAAKTD